MFKRFQQQEPLSIRTAKAFYINKGVGEYFLDNTGIIDSKLKHKKELKELIDKYQLIRVFHNKIKFIGYDFINNCIESLTIFITKDYYVSGIKMSIKSMPVNERDELR